jgi:hypothetical protein
VDPARYQVGSGKNRINPRTGLMEFDDEEMNAPEPPLESLKEYHPLETPNPLPDPETIAGSVDLGSYGSPATFRGLATWYNLPGAQTATGKLFDPDASAAAMYRPGQVKLGDTVTVQLQNPPHTSITVPINDSGPFLRGPDNKAVKPLQPDPQHVIDLTPRAFRSLAGNTDIGKVPVVVTVNPRSGGR